MNEIPKELSEETIKFYKPEQGKIPVAETFFSIQGEGPTQGVLSIFLRTQGCNLKCKFAGEWCDTIPTWAEGTYYSYEDLINLWKERGWWQSLEKGAHIILTGGEPTLRQYEFVGLFKKIEEELGYIPYTEVETNSTRAILPSFDGLISQYNCSPKLESSAQAFNVRYKPKILEWYVRNPRAIFKFVVTSQRDLEEINRDFVYKFEIPNKRIWLMPVADTREELEEHSLEVVNLAMKYGYNYSSRLQLLIWDRVVGV